MNVTKTPSAAKPVGKDGKGEKGRKKKGKREKGKKMRSLSRTSKLTHACCGSGLLWQAFIDGEGEGKGEKKERKVASGNLVQILKTPLCASCGGSEKEKKKERKEKKGKGKVGCTHLGTGLESAYASRQSA